MKISELLIEGVNIWHGKYVVAVINTLRIVVDNPSGATNVSVWTDKNNKVGNLSTRVMPIEPDYLSIAKVSLNEKYRGRKIGLAMFQALLKHLGPNWKGISSYLPDQYNTNQMPKIWNRLGAKVSAETPDMIIVDK